MLYKYQGNRIEVLAGALADLLRLPLGNALVPETIVVQSNGMARWLQLQLARELGVCSNIKFPYPAAFQWQVYRQLLPNVPEHSPFDRGILAWRIFAEIMDPGGAPLAEIAAYADGKPDDDLMTLAMRIAETYDSYLVYRPDWILAWEQGQETHWQAQLWRRLVASASGPHRVHLQVQFDMLLASGNRPVLPSRIVLFGLSSLAPSLLDWFAKLGTLTDVHLFLLNPSQEAWDHIQDERQIARLSQSAGALAEALHLETGNSLLASWGKQGRDFLDLHLKYLTYEHDGQDHFVPGTSNSLLTNLQEDILLLRNRVEGGGGDPATVADNDNSLQIHVCHSPAREVEVLHDRLLAMLDANPDLATSDIVVMTPDIDAYAPYIEAIFGSQEGRHRLPYSIADRSIRQSSPLLEAFFRLLALPDSRHDVETLLAFLAHPAIGRRFAVNEADLAHLEGWVRATNIRWGLDAAARGRLGLPECAEHTWDMGLKRLALGYALPLDDSGGLRDGFGGINPHDAVEGGQAELLGKLLCFMEAIEQTTARLTPDQDVASWQVVLAEVLELFFLAEDEDEEILLQILRSINSMAQSACRGSYNRPVSRQLVANWLQTNLQVPRDTGFLHGGITFCAMVPMRAIPFRIVCLLGINDGSFPRLQRPYDFDLIPSSYRKGDRSRREDDRYLFLEALLSARQVFYISYCGRQVRDNSVLPPSVLVADLLDYLAVNYRSRSGQPINDALVVQHPLQPFSPRYFSGSEPLFSYSQAMCDAAQGLLLPRQAAPRFAPMPLSPVVLDAPLGLDRLIEFWQRPARFFLRERLKINLKPASSGWQSREPFHLEGRAAREIRGLRLQQILAKKQMDLLPVLRGRGLLPHGLAGNYFFRQEAMALEPFAQHVADRQASAMLEPFYFQLPVAGTRLEGYLTNLTGNGWFGYQADSLWDADLLAMWLRHLVLCAVAPAGVVCQSEFLTPGKDYLLTPVLDPLLLLSQLVEGYQQGLRAPLPFFARASFAYARRKIMNKDGMLDARKAWEPADYVPEGSVWQSESEDPWNALAFRGQDPLDDGFVVLAERIVLPLLHHLKEINR